MNLRHIAHKSVFDILFFISANTLLARVGSRTARANSSHNLGKIYATNEMDSKASCVPQHKAKTLKRGSQKNLGATFGAAIFYFLKKLFILSVLQEYIVFPRHQPERKKSAGPCAPRTFLFLNAFRRCFYVAHAHSGVFSA